MTQPVVPKTQAQLAKDQLRRDRMRKRHKTRRGGSKTGSTPTAAERRRRGGEASELCHVDMTRSVRRGTVLIAVYDRDRGTRSPLHPVVVTSVEGHGAERQIHVVRILGGIRNSKDLVELVDYQRAGLNRHSYVAPQPFVIGPAEIVRVLGEVTKADWRHIAEGLLERAVETAVAQIRRDAA